MKAAILLLAILSILAPAQSQPIAIAFASISAACSAPPGCSLTSAVSASVLNLLQNLGGLTSNTALDFSAAGNGLYINIDTNVNVQTFAAAGSNTITVLSSAVVTTTNFTVSQSSSAVVQGSISITGTGTFFVDSSSSVFVAAAGQINAGATNVVANGQANVAGQITTTGSYAQNAGNLVLNSTTATQASTAAVVASAITIGSSATISGNGNLGSASQQTTVTMTGNAALNIGNSPGVVTINGDWKPSATSVFNLEVQSQTSYDQLFVTGRAYPNGFLRVTLLNSYTPGDNTRFNFITAGSTQGSFSSTTGTATNTLTKWTSSVTSTNVIANYNSAVSVAISGLVLVACVLASLL